MPAGFGKHIAMSDAECVQFLQWALPRLGMRWAGFRKVRRQVCKRLRRRLTELGVTDLATYRAHLERHPDEWAALEQLTHITISRFHRDRGVFACVQREVLPALAADAITRGSEALKVWSAGCGSGEEPYTLTIIWQLGLARRFPEVKLRVLATDVDGAILARARQGSYPPSSLRELPERWREAAFVRDGARYCLREELKQPVTLAAHDVRDQPPGGPFDLLLCRNLAFTYFDLGSQRATAARLTGALRAGGALVLGAHEALPADVDGLEPWVAGARIYRRIPAV
jgi:chemotaxis protein methyltransferase CheR